LGNVKTLTLDVYEAMLNNGLLGNEGVYYFGIIVVAYLKRESRNGILKHNI